MTKEMKAAQAESIATLRELLKPGDTVTTLVRKVSPSGMSRRISLTIARENEVRDITWHAARAFGEPVKQRGEWVRVAGLFVVGCGMDMCFNTVYNLGRVLFPDGFGEESLENMGRKIRPLTKEKATKTVACGYVFRGQNGDASGWNNDGGYALRKRDL